MFLDLKKNLISVSTIEDQGYEVTFRHGQAIVYPIGDSIDSGMAWEIVQVRFSAIESIDEQCQ